MEYSEKDDKFRVLINGCRFAETINLAGILKCRIVGDAYCSDTVQKKCSEKYIVAELYDGRNSLERFLLHFSHFKKEAKQTSENDYQIKIYYDKNDETELLIRVLSFGQFIKVTEPEEFVGLIKKRLTAQKSCGLG